MKESIIQEILKQYQKEYQIMNELYRLSEELERANASNDKVSIRLVLEMRQDAIDNMGKSRSSVEMLTEAMGAEERRRFRQMLKGEPGYEPESWEEKKILEIRENIRRVLDRTIAVDRRVSMKLAGKNSYYSTAPSSEQTHPHL